MNLSLYRNMRTSVSMTDLDKYKGRIVAEMLLPCRAFPLRRGRSRSRRYKGIYQPLGDQEEMMECMLPHSGLGIDFPIICEIYCGYQALYQKNRHQVDIKILSYDVDNLCKAVLDNMQRMRVIMDDRLAMGITCIKFVAKTDHTLIKLYKAEGYNHAKSQAVSDRGCYEDHGRSSDE